jgi:hypothetical protein
MTVRLRIKGRTGNVSMPRGIGRSAMRDLIQRSSDWAPSQRLMTTDVSNADLSGSGCDCGEVADRHSKSRYAWLTIATLAAIACPTVVHRAILAALLAGRLICRKSNRANHRGENRKENLCILFHTRSNVRT